MYAQCKASTSSVSFVLILLFYCSNGGGGVLNTSFTLSIYNNINVPSTNWWIKCQNSTVYILSLIYNKSEGHHNGISMLSF